MTHFPDGAGGYAGLAVVDADQVARIVESNQAGGKVALTVDS